MRILAVDTALGACSAAVLDGDSVLGHRFEMMERGHAERLASMVRETMDDAGVAFEDLERLAVTVGPGTFTGQRVGYAFMRGLRVALKQPLSGVTTLAAMAASAVDETGLLAAAVLHDAKRDQVYSYAEASGRIVLPVQLAAREDAIRAIHDATPCTALALAGTAAAWAREYFRGNGRPAVETNIHAPDALWVARLALLQPEPDSIPLPLYLRPPDARLPAPA